MTWRTSFMLRLACWKSLLKIGVLRQCPQRENKSFGFRVQALEWRTVTEEGFTRKATRISGHRCFALPGGFRCDRRREAERTTRSAANRRNEGGRAARLADGMTKHVRIAETSHVRLRSIQIDSALRAPHPLTPKCRNIKGGTAEHNTRPARSIEELRCLSSFLICSRPAGSGDVELPVDTQQDWVEGFSRCDSAKHKTQQCLLMFQTLKA